MANKNQYEKIEYTFNNMLKKIETTINETAIELFTDVVRRTPIKSGDTISNWKVSINSMSNEVPTANYHYDRYVDSKSTADEIARSFEQQIAGTIKSAEIDSTFYLINETPYILTLENGGYTGRLYNKKHSPYYPDPPYSPPYTLTESGYSKKAPVGMVKVTLLESGRVFSIKAQQEL